MGVGALQQKRAQDARTAALGEAVAADRARHVQEQVESFKTHLERFARLHRSEINKDPEFRAAFARMTASIGVDPLASSKGFWGEALGLGDFYYELAIQIADVCMATRAVNGGLLSMDDLLNRLRRMRGGKDHITDADVSQALKKLASLGGGYRIVALGGAGRYVLSVPEELSADTADVLRAATAAGRAYIMVDEVCGATPATDGMRALPGWDRGRAQRACDSLLRDGLAWLDAQAGPSGPRYYIAALNSHVLL